MFKIRIVWENILHQLVVFPLNFKWFFYIPAGYVFVVSLKNHQIDVLVENMWTNCVANNTESSHNFQVVAWRRSWTYLQIETVSFFKHVFIAYLNSCSPDESSIEVPIFNVPFIVPNCNQYLENSKSNHMKPIKHFNSVDIKKHWWIWAIYTNKIRQ